MPHPPQGREDTEIRKKMGQLRLELEKLEIAPVVEGQGGVRKYLSRLKGRLVSRA